MRHFFRLYFAFRLSPAALLLILLSFLPSCEFLGKEDGDAILRLHFSEMSYKQVISSSYTKGASSLPDPGEFILTIIGSKGDVLYQGKYADSPESLLVKPGTYNVSIKSSDFDVPAFSAPQYGDEQCVTVSSGEAADVTLMCSQINSGIKLHIAPEFLDHYPSEVLFLRSAEGRLMYGYSERRIAYFKPGNVSLTMNSNVDEKVLFTRILDPGSVLSIKLVSSSKPSPSGGGSIRVEVDTSRVWSSEEFDLSESGGTSGGSDSDAMSVAEAKANIGAEGVWVAGYIVGGDMTSSAISFDGPFESLTNIAIASRRVVTDKNSCLSVQLSKGEVRDALNLAENPENLKRKVYLKGDIVSSYYGIPGIKNIKDFSLE